ncbi:ABATE domain-containing protein, partial [Actinomadura adrarensis]
MLDSTDGLATWLRSNGLDGRATADDATLDALRRTREVLLALVDAASEEAASEGTPSEGTPSEGALSDGAPSDGACEGAPSTKGPSAEARDALNRVLEHGALRHRLT